MKNWLDTEGFGNLVDIVATEFVGMYCKVVVCMDFLYTLAEKILLAVGGDAKMSKIDWVEADIYGLKRGK